MRVMSVGLNHLLAAGFLCTVFVWADATAADTITEYIVEEHDPCRDPELEATKDLVKARLYRLNMDFCEDVRVSFFLREELTQQTLKSRINAKMDENKALVLSLFDPQNSAYDELEQDVSRVIEEYQDVISKQDHKELRLYSFYAGNVSLVMSWAVSGPSISMGLRKYEASGICKTLYIDGQPQAYATCQEAFAAISEGINTYLRGYESAYIEPNLQLISNLEKTWDDYMTRARSQTWLDENVDFWLNCRHYGADHLVGPAQVQYFFLHPGLVYEWVDGEPDGNRDKASASLEVFGANWWNLKVPLGVSAMLIASDRANFDAVSPAISFYIDNRYSFGVAYRNAKSEAEGIDDEWSFFVNIDLLNYSKQRASQLENYREMLKQRE